MNKNLRWNILISIMAVVFICGCGQPEMLELKKTSIDEKNAAVIAGTWQCYYPVHWEITFGEDGTLQKVFHNTGVEIIVAEGGKTMLGPNEEEATFLLGPFNVEYKENNLNMTFRIDYFKMELPQGTLEGWIKDTLIGKLSEDKSTWTVKWYCYSRLKLGDKWSDEPNIKEINVSPTELIFKKSQRNQ